MKTKIQLISLMFNDYFAKYPTLNRATKKWMATLNGQLTSSGLTLEELKKKVTDWIYW
jgi:hypothetical protein